MKQISGKEAIPESDRPNPPKTIGSFDDAELPLSYGYGARGQYGSSFPSWSDDLELKLRDEWESGHGDTGKRWDDVKDYVRSGYEYKPH